MRALTRGLVVLGVLAVLVAVFLLNRPDPEPTQTPQAEPEVSLISSKGVEKSISERLTARTGRQVVATCPRKVNEKVGTTFECEVAYEDDDTVATTAKVKITGGGGQFEWTTENAPEESGEPSDAPSDGVDVE